MGLSSKGHIGGRGWGGAVDHKGALGKPCQELTFAYDLRLVSRACACVRASVRAGRPTPTAGAAELHSDGTLKKEHLLPE